MALAPLALTLEVVPRSRLDLIDVAAHACRLAGDLHGRYERALYCSHHTTAGFLDQHLSERLGNDEGRLRPYVHDLCRYFPAGAGYSHDRLDERTELSHAQRLVEPRNADSHLAFMASGLASCVVYAHRPGVPVYLLDLDGRQGARVRRRRATVVLHEREQTAAHCEIDVPVSGHAVDAINLGDPRFGLTERIDDLLAREGIAMGRIHLSLATAERHAALTVNEFETLLMRHDLAEVLRDPLRFVAGRARRALRDPGSLVARGRGYAKYDLVRLLNVLIDRLGGSGVLLERVTRRLMALPAERLLRFKRSLSLLAAPHPEGGARIVQGTYQTPILIQWCAAPRRTRRLILTVTRLV